MAMRYLYLHGFSSSQNSVKAEFFKTRLARHGIELLIPDMNLGNFTELTISKQVDYVKHIVNGCDDSWCLIGSSLGGLISLIIAEQCCNVHKLILMAPAINIKQLWDKQLGSEQILQWRHKGVINIYHTGFGHEVELNYSFIEDLALIQDQGFTRKDIPVLLIHGNNDATIPITVSKAYAADKPLARLVIPDSGHALTDSLDLIWNESCEFLNLQNCAKLK